MPAVGALGRAPDTQLSGASSSSPTPRRRTTCGSAAVVAKFELDPEILAFEERDHGLQLVARRRGHPDFITLDARLHLLESLVLDCLDDSLRDILRNPLGECQRATDALSCRLL